MNVYDFDNTIYDGDSTIDFYLFCLKKHKGIFVCLPKQIYGLVLYKVKVIDKTKFKERFFCFLRKLKNVDTDIKLFWDKQEGNIKEWYVENQLEDDVIISASPDFLLRDICERIGIRYLIASEVDKQTGIFMKENCYGEEKVKRFLSEYPNSNINKFYSDSYSDAPLAGLSQESFLVKGNDICEWVLKKNEEKRDD